VNGFTAEGIYYAMVSGEHAGLTALNAIRNRNLTAEFLRRHDRACEAEIGHELRKSVVLQKRLFANPALIDSVVRFAKRNDTARKLLARFGVGEISYEEFKKRTITEALPGYLRYQFEKAWHKAARFPGAAFQTRRT
jgi:flavin-dependent dehydrogenase